MADVVLNHVGYGDTAHGYNPFYKDEYFHNCSVLRAEGVGAHCNACVAQIINAHSTAWLGP